MRRPVTTRNVSDDTPYEEPRPVGRDALSRVNAIPGLRTIGSCGGHPEGDGELPADEWRVTVQAELDEDRPPDAVRLAGAGMVRMAGHDGLDRGVWLVADAHPPWLNDPGTMLTHMLRGSVVMRAASSPTSSRRT